MSGAWDHACLVPAADPPFAPPPETSALAWPGLGSGAGKPQQAGRQCCRAVRVGAMHPKARQHRVNGNMHMHACTAHATHIRGGLGVPGVGPPGRHVKLQGEAGAGTDVRA